MTAILDNHGLLIALLMLVGLAGVIMAASLKSTTSLKSIEGKQDYTLEKLDQLMSELASTEIYIEYLKEREKIG